ncbi:lipoprotein [Moraxella sp.]|nr:lipoprotein [Moraxella sp.]MCP3897163.1 lipoprotein [Moraxella sp.]
MKTAILSIALCALLTACGQKGALYLPTKTAPTEPINETISANPNDY